MMVVDKYKPDPNSQYSQYTLLMMLSTSSTPSKEVEVGGGGGCREERGRGGSNVGEGGVGMT